MKSLIIGDLHYGEKGDSPQFNQWVNTFLEEAVKTAKDKGATHAIQLGDFFHQRNKVNVLTLNYGIKGAQILSNAFGRDNVIVLAGNHCLYYDARLDVSSLGAISEYVTVIDKPTTIGESLYTPWIIDNAQWDEVVSGSTSHKYLFAHLELRGFRMNENYVQEHGNSHKELAGYERVITGHYHVYQELENIVYLGTPIPNTFSEANVPHYYGIFDHDSGKLELVEYGKTQALSINHTKLDDLVEAIKNNEIDPSSSIIRLEYGDDFSDESLIDEQRLKLQELGFAEVKTQARGGVKKIVEDERASSVEDIEDIDQVVLTVIKDSPVVEGVDNELLASLYLEAKNKENQDA